MLDMKVHQIQSSHTSELMAVAAIIISYAFFYVHPVKSITPQLADKFQHGVLVCNIPGLQYNLTWTDMFIETAYLRMAHLVYIVHKKPDTILMFREGTWNCWSGWSG